MKLSNDAQQVLKEFNARSERENKLMQTLDPQTGMARRDEFLLPVGEEVGQFLHTLILARNAQCIVEIGTSYGYSTLFLADAARLTGGKVITLELSAEKQRYAQNAINRAGLGEHVYWRQGDALRLIDDINQSVDFVLLDIWKELYIPCLDRIYPRLADRGLIVADNILEPSFHRSDALAYQNRVRSLERIQNSQLINIGSGLELSIFKSLQGRV